MKHFIGLVISGLLASGSYAQAIEIYKINGHEILLPKQDFEDVLKVDGREMHRNAIILFKELTTVSEFRLSSVRVQAEAMPVTAAHLF